MDPSPSEGRELLKLTRGAGLAPVWAPDMTELYYRHASAVWAVETEPIFRMGEHRMLFDGPYASSTFGADYDVHPWGAWFAMTKLGVGARA